MGDITSINPQLLNTLVADGYLPVVASVAADSTGQALNVNADIAAGEVCQAACLLPIGHLRILSPAGWACMQDSGSALLLLEGTRLHLVHACS